MIAFPAVINIHSDVALDALSRVLRAILSADVSAAFSTHTMICIVCLLRSGFKSLPESCVATPRCVSMV